MKTELEELMLDDLTLPEAPTTGELSDLTKLVERQLHLQRLVEEIEARLDGAKEMLRVVQEELIPQTMDSIGIKDFRLSNGLVVKVKDDIFASIRKEFNEQAIAWLDANGLGGIVKDEVKVAFGKGEAQTAFEFVEYCKKSGYNAEERLSVHPQTLKATVKEQLARGVEFPDTFFSIAPIRKATISVK